MRRYQRLLRVLFLDGFRAAPGWMALIAAMLVLGSVAATCYPLGYRLLVDGALDHDSRRVVWGVVVVAGLLSLGWVLTAIGATEAMALSDRVSLYRTGELIRLISGVRGLEHLERHEYLGNVERLNANRRQLAGAPRQLLTNIATAARVAALLVLLGLVSPWLLLLPLCAVPPLVADRLAKRITREADDDMAYPRRLAGMLFSLACDVSSAAEVRAYGLAPRLAGEHRRLADEIDRRSTREALGVLGVQAVGWLLYASGLMAAIAFVVIRSAHGALSIGTVLMAVSLIRRSRNQLASAAQGSGALVSTLATADRLFWLEDHAAERRALAGTRPAPASLREGIRIERLRFSYPGSEVTAIEGLDVLIPAGRTVALVGENGSGKTTLIKLLLGMYEPDEGRILIDDVPLDELDPDSWRSRCTAAFQDFSRFHLPAVESIGIADLGAIDDEPAAQTALARAGFADFPEQLPEGLATRVGNAYTGGHGLSGGQWQRLALGRAMRREAPLLAVLDEPTASLDPLAEHRLFERYALAAERNAQESGAITVLVSHRFSTVQAADLIIYMDAGRAIETGSHEELLARGGMYAELYTMQAAGYR
jgi:ATP-binding cassette subfamily B protein